MSDATFGGANSSALRQQLIAQIVQRELITASVGAKSILDVSRFAEPGAKSIDFPRAGSFAVQKIAEDEEVSAQALTYAVDNLALDQHAVVQWIIPKRSALQSRVALLQDSIARAARAHAKQVDKDILTAMFGGIQSGDNVSISTNVALDDITEAKRKLANKNWPEENLWLWGSEEFYEDLLKLDNMSNVDKYGGREALVEGRVARLYGINVIKSPLVKAVTGATKSAFLYSSEAMAIGFQQMPDFDEQKELKRLATRYSLDQLYGLKVLQASADVGIIKIST